MTLEAITGISFRLPKSGRQRGIDGEAAIEEAIAFECKRYKDSLPRAEVVSKIPDFVRYREHADLVWILFATCSVSTQLVEDLRADGTREGISVLVLDWPSNELPRLALALAMGGEKVENFFKFRCDTSKQLADALAAIRAEEHFQNREQAIRRELDAPGIAMAMAEEANASWFRHTVSSKANARLELGQPIAPEDRSITVLDRHTLIKTLSFYLEDTSDANVICVHGEEGCGKSWLAIQSWLSQRDAPLLAFLTANSLSEEATEMDIEELSVVT